MAVYKRDMVDINLETGNIHRSFLKHSIGYKDTAADHFGIRVFRNGEPVSLTGVSVQGIFMPPQGDPIAITTGNIVSGNEAEVVLPQACYNYDGQFTLAIKLVDATNAVTGTMRIVDGMVDNTHASGTVAPTSAVPTYQEVLSAYEQAIAVIGNSVRFDQSQSMTDTQKGTARTNIAAASESELSDVKSALNSVIDNSYMETNRFDSFVTIGRYVLVNSVGRPGTDSGNLWVSLPYGSSNSVWIYAGSSITVNEGYVLSYSLWSQPVTSNVSTNYRYIVSRNLAAGTVVNIEKDCYIFLAVKKANDTQLADDEDLPAFMANALTISINYSAPKEEFGKVYSELTEIKGSLTDALIENDSAVGYMLADGTINTQYGGEIKKYSIPTGLSDIWISGKVNLTSNVSNPYCVLWFVDNGALITGKYVAVTTKPQEWGMYKVSIPSGASEIWADSNIVVHNTDEMYNDVGKKLAELTQKTAIIPSVEETLTESMIPSSEDVGYMLADGTITTQYGGTIKKYIVPDGATSVRISGSVNFNVSSPNYCVLWFVAEGELISGEYVPVITKPQSWELTIVQIPNNAEQIWADSNITVYESNEIAQGIANRVLELETSGGFNFTGAFPWTKKVLGLRMLADAQGCYFIPFNALGMGVSRGNGTNGNSYVADQIHPTELGGYNVACGVWSYIKNIPCWHTSIPESTPSFDGSQWQGKKWYAYGTSLTEIGYYPSFVAAMSGMIVTNKGKGGGALVTNRQIYNRLLDMTDGKLEADLITIEVGANDVGDLGDPWSVDINTFNGALNHCIHEMFAGGVQAQIVIMASYPGRYEYGHPSNKYDVNTLYNT